MELALELISKKWVILILRDMFFGKKRFNEFKEGKIDILISFENYSEEGKQVIINKELVKEYMEQFKILAIVLLLSVYWAMARTSVCSLWESIAATSLANCSFLASGLSWLSSALPPFTAAAAAVSLARLSR